MKIKIKPKVVIKVLIIYWSSLLILWLLLKKLPEIRDSNKINDLFQNVTFEYNK